VAAWWSFHSKSVLPELDAESAPFKYQTCCNSLKEVFPEEDDRKKAKLLNKTRVFRVRKDGPLDYVMAKLNLFDRIDSNMEKSKQLHYLFKGLPAQIAHTVHRNLGNDACVNDFIKELKYQCNDPHFHLFTSSTQNPEVPSELYDPDYNPPNPPKPQPTRNFNYPNKYPFIGEIKQQMCGYCDRAGHHIRQCYIFNRHYVARHNIENPQDPPNSSQNPKTAPPQNSQNTPMRPNNGGRPFTRSQNTPDNRRTADCNTLASLMHVDVLLPPNHVSGNVPRSGYLNEHQFRSGLHLENLIIDFGKLSIGQPVYKVDSSSQTEKENLGFPLYPPITGENTKEVVGNSEIPSSPISGPPQMLENPPIVTEDCRLPLNSIPYSGPPDRATDPPR
ncbi:unnamed protein product, partial [Allacma fusca]